MTIPWPRESEGSTIYYVAGAIIHSILNSNKCIKYKDILLDDDSFSMNINNINTVQYVNDVNRGGLFKPSEYVF